MLDTAVTATGEVVGIERFPHPHHAPGQVKHEKVSMHGRPLAYRKVAHQRTAIATAYPDDGNMVVQSATTTTIVLPANMPTTGVDFVNLFAVIVQGTGVGQWRQILGFVAGTRTATISGLTLPGGTAPVNAPWSPVPDSTSRVVLLVDLFELNQVHWKIEYADGGSVVRVRPVLFAVPAAGRAPEVLVDDDPEDLVNIASSYLVTESGYVHGAPVERQSRGALGGKLYVDSYQGTGSAAFSIWGAGV